MKLLWGGEAFACLSLLSCSAFCFLLLLGEMLGEGWAFSSRCAKNTRSALYVEIKPVGRSALCSVGRGNELVACVPWRE